jgi:hypothetical protein
VTKLNGKKLKQPQKIVFKNKMRGQNNTGRHAARPARYQKR